MVIGVSLLSAFGQRTLPDIEYMGPPIPAIGMIGRRIMDYLINT